MINKFCKIEIKTSLIINNFQMGRYFFCVKKYIYVFNIFTMELNRLKDLIEFVERDLLNHAIKEGV